MSKEIRNSIFNLPEGGSSGSSWTPQRMADTFLFYGETSKISGGRLNNQVSGSSDWLTVAGSAGSETYQAPDNATYKTADTDKIWFKQDATRRTVTTAELIGYDLQRTPVKYLDDSPNTISLLGILKAGVTPNYNQLFKLFELPIEWHNDTNGYGHNKNNRIGQNLFDPEEILGPELVDQVAWCAVGLAYYNEKAGWTGDGSKLISNNGTALLKYFLLPTGFSYRMTCTVVRTSGNLLFTAHGINISISGGYSYIITSTNDYLNYFEGQTGFPFQGSITAWSIKRILYP